MRYNSVCCLSWCFWWSVSFICLFSRGWIHSFNAGGSRTVDVGFTSIGSVSSWNAVSTTEIIGMSPREANLELVTPVSGLYSLSSVCIRGTLESMNENFPNFPPVRY